MKESLMCCPFCGHLEVEVCRTNPKACWIRCASCGADAESAPKRKGAFSNWNRRSVAREGRMLDDDDKRWFS